MPRLSPKRLGRNPPSEKFTEAKGVVAENTHVLFEGNTNVTRPHEDKKLFGFIAKNKSKKALVVNVHGYASVEGGTQYNLNLSELAVSPPGRRSFVL